MANLIKIKRGLKEDLPILKRGELGYATNTNELFIGVLENPSSINDNKLVNDLNDYLVYKGTFGSASSTTEGDLPSSGQEVGHVYLADTNYSSTVAGVNFRAGDKALWDGASWKKNEAISLEIADESTAIAGINNVTYMTPLRTSQAINSRIQYFTATIAQADWSSAVDGFTAVKSITGLLSTDKPLVDIDLSSVAFANIETVQNEYTKIYRVATTADNEITFYATEALTEDIAVNIQVVR